MKLTTVHVPLALLKHPDLTASAKLLWMAARLDPATPDPAQLEQLTRFSHPTIKKGLAELSAAGWSPSAAGLPPPPTVPMPGHLVIDRRVCVLGRLLYGFLQATPGFAGSEGSFTHTGLSGLAGVSPKPVREAIPDLTKTGWLIIRKFSQMAPIPFTLCYPERDRRQAESDQFMERFNEAARKGEHLMKEYLNLLIDSDEYTDNTRPAYLVNLQTGELMEFDRLYHAGVAFEFNGPHHDGATETVSAAQSHQQQIRDCLKHGVAAQRGMRLITIRAADLSLEVMQAKVAGTGLPLRDPSDHDLLTTAIEQQAGDYRAWARSKSRH